MIAAADREGVESRIRSACQSGENKGAATALLEGYGRELLGFLLAHMSNREVATEAFSQFTEDLWRGLPGFRWQCSARVWAYALLRNAATRHFKDAARRRRRHVPLSQAGPLSEIEAKVRTSTLRAFRTDAKDGLTQLRESLAPEDQMLLILRVNRQLGWKEIARVMFHESEAVAEETLAKEAVRLRQRYQAVKVRLRRLAKEAGLVSADVET